MTIPVPYRGNAQDYCPLGFEYLHGLLTEYFEDFLQILEFLKILLRCSESLPVLYCWISPFLKIVQRSYTSL